MHAVHGKVLEIDLTEKTSWVREVEEEVFNKYLGGSALACYLTRERLLSGGDAFSPQNALTFMTGPFTGSGLTSVGRHAITALSPLTGYWGEATCGGMLAQNLKGCGFDGVIITGKSANPVYLYITPEGVEFKAAEHHWGKNTFDTFAGVKSETQQSAQVAAIGPAGENLVRYANVMRSGGGAAGRCGMGAVMGDKKLKAVALRGQTRYLPPLANPDAFKVVAQEVYREVDLKSDLLREYGTLGYIDVGMYFGDVPDKYFTNGEFPVEKISAGNLRQHFLVETKACCKCAIFCKKRTSFSDAELPTWGPEYETAVALGSLLGIYDLGSICQANKESNAYGIDTISAGVSLGFAAYLLETGKLNEHDLGISFSFGDSEKMIELLKMISFRQQVGDLLAEGVKRMAEKLKVDPGLAAHVKGLEIPMHEPRAFEGQALTYATSSRGACHQRGDFYMVDLGQLENPQEIDLLPGDRHQVKGRVKQVITMQDYRELFNNLLLCNYAAIPLSVITHLLMAALGWEFTPQDVLDKGRRSNDLKRDLNCDLGLTPREDLLPDIVCRPLSNGAAAGKEIYLEDLLPEYYQERQWDEEKGRPQRDTGV